MTLEELKTETARRKRLNNLVRKWRRRSEDYGPIPARAYLEAANDLESELKKMDAVPEPVTP